MHHADDSRTINNRTVTDLGTESSPTSAAGRTLDVLRAFLGPKAVLGVSEVALRAGVPKSTAHRFLGVLLDEGFVRREGNRYRLAEEVFSLGARAIGPLGLRERAIPFMVELHHATLQTVHLGVLHGQRVLYVEKIYGHRSHPCPTMIGGSNPAHCTALGKAILSHSRPEVVEAFAERPLSRMTKRSLHTTTDLLRSLDASRENGVSIEYEESCNGLACVAVPILDQRGEAVAALSISSSTIRLDKRRFVSQLRRAADALSLRAR